MTFEPSNAENIDLDNNFMDEEHSNFRAFGIGKATEKQVRHKKARKEKRAEAKEERKGMNLFQKFTNITQKGNPAAIIPRLGTMAGLRLNIFGLSRRLYPALLTAEQLKAGNYDLTNAALAKKKLADVHKMWIMLGGRGVSLDEAIRKGFDKPIFKTHKIKESHRENKGVSAATPLSKATSSFTASEIDLPEVNTREFDLGFTDEQYSNFAMYDDAAEVIAGLGILGGFVAKIAGVAQNPYKKGTPQADQAAADLAAAQAAGDLEAKSASDAEIKKLAEAAATEEADTIMGIPKTGFFIGVGLLVVLIVGGIILSKKKHATA